MTQFDDRKDAFEKKYAHDAEMMFKAEARACKLFGRWLGPQLGFSESETEAYAKDIIGANLEEPGFDDVLRFVMPDIEKKGLTLSRTEVERKLNALYDDAKVQLMKEDAA